MKPEKDKKTGKWLIQYRYRDWTGKLRKSMKRGFNTRREAEEWLRNFLLKQQSDFDMRFKDFADLYFKDMEARLREHTMINKHYIMDDKVLPYFGKKKMNEITPADIRKWQTELINKGYSKTYLKTINNSMHLPTALSISGNPGWHFRFCSGPGCGSGNCWHWKSMM